MEKRERKMYLPSIDDLFTTQEERDSVDLEKVIHININEIDDFPEHPFKVIVNDEMNEMVESIKEKGVLVPTIVRKKDDGRYEMISGHRRKKASELLGIETVPCIVRNLTDEEATIIMVDSNLQREKILPSEKAFAYKMKLEAMNHQGSRKDLTSTPVVSKLRSNEMLGKEIGESREQIRRYIRLTYLIPKLLEYVDNDVIKDNDKPSIALRPAVELSYLKEEEQQQLLDYIDFNMVTPSLAQAIKLKNMSEKGTFNIDSMELLLEEDKPNQTPKLKVSMNRLSSLLPNNLKNDREREEYVIKAVEWYDRYTKHKQKERSQER